VKVSGATLPDRYKYLKGEQLWGAVGAHESGHQDPKNLELQKRLQELDAKIDAAGDNAAQEDLDEQAELTHKLDVEPVQLELKSLIEYDVLYPDKAGNWLSKNFEGFLGKDIYQETVKSVVEGLVQGGYIDETKKDNLVATYLHHTKAVSTEK
jgi:hypothetical protein